MTHRGRAPVAIFIHSRPRETARVLETVKNYQPTALYVVADGPRAEVYGERERCREALAMVDSFEWQCPVHFLTRRRNIGSGRSVKEGLDWVFSQEKMAIILEDDTVPDSTFFPFCEQLLFRYEDVPSIGMISGNNVIGHAPDVNASYFFSQIPTTWGWATWQRAWANNDFEMNWLMYDAKASISKISINRRHLYYWKWALTLIREKKVDAWDWQWNASLALNGQLTVVPASNLVENIGFGEGATHTFRIPRGIKPGTSSLAFPMTHPGSISRCRPYEKRMLREFLPDRRPARLAFRSLRGRLTQAILDPLYRSWHTSEQNR